MSIRKVQPKRIEYIEAKENIAYVPSQGEQLEGYAERLRDTLAQYEGWLQTHVKWYTHYGMGACPICDLLNMSRYQNDIINDICQELKTRKFKLIAERPKGTTDHTFFEFKLVKKSK